MSDLNVEVGQVAHLYTLTPFVDTMTGLAADPNSVRLIIERKDHTQYIYGWPTAGVSGSLTHTGVGAFEVYVPITVEMGGQPLEGRWESTGTAQDAHRFIIFVRAPNVTLA